MSIKTTSGISGSATSTGSFGRVESAGAYYGIGSYSESGYISGSSHEIEIAAQSSGMQSAQIILKGRASGDGVSRGAILFRTATHQHTTNGPKDAVTINLSGSVELHRGDLSGSAASTSSFGMIEIDEPASHIKHHWRGDAYYLRTASNLRIAGYIFADGNINLDAGANDIRLGSSSGGANTVHFKTDGSTDGISIVQNHLSGSSASTASFGLLQWGDTYKSQLHNPNDGFETYLKSARDIKIKGFNFKIIDSNESDKLHLMIGNEPKIFATTGSFRILAGATSVADGGSTDGGGGFGFLTYGSTGTHIFASAYRPGGNTGNYGVQFHNHYGSKATGSLLIKDSAKIDLLTLDDAIISGSSTSTGSFGSLVVDNAVQGDLQINGNAYVKGGGLDLDSNQKITGQLNGNGGTEFSYIRMYNGGNASINIGTKHSLGFISFESGNGAYTERMRIKNNGDIAIYDNHLSGSTGSTGSFGRISTTGDGNIGGNLDVGSSLDVTGNVIASNYLKAGGNLIVGSADGLAVRFDDSNSTDSSQFSIHQNGASGKDIVLNANGSGNRVILSNAQTASLATDQDNNVLFPATNAKISGSATSTGSFGTLQVPGGNDFGIGLHIHDGGLFGASANPNPSANGIVIESTTNTGMTIHSGGSARIGIIAFSATDRGHLEGVLKYSHVYRRFEFDTEDVTSFTMGGGASGILSGSSTSTGSFGNIVADGNIDVVDGGTRTIGNGDEYLQFFNSAVYLFGNEYQFIKGRNDNQLFFMNDKIQMNSTGNLLVQYQIESISNALYLKGAGSSGGYCMRFLNGSTEFMKVYDADNTIEFCLANQKISGSSSSTGSFGSLVVADKVSGSLTIEDGVSAAKLSIGGLNDVVDTAGSNLRINSGGESVATEIYGFDASTSIKLGSDEKIQITGSVSISDGIEFGQKSTQTSVLNVYKNAGDSNSGVAHFVNAEAVVNDDDFILRLEFDDDAAIDANNDYIQFLDQNGEVGRIHSEVSYGTFTGTHVSQRPSGSSYDDWKPGMIVKSTGNILATGSTMALAWPEVELTTTQKDKTVMGVWEANNPSGSHKDKYLDRSLPRINYNAVGEGRIRVTDTGGNIETGDYICSSVRTGHGEKQDDDLLHNYTVAKATQPYNFASASTDSDLGYKSILIGCTYHCG